MKSKVDPRTFSEARIENEFLPYVSRRALSRVVDWIPPPESCCHCGGEVFLIPNSAIYGRSYGKWPYAYACPECDAYVGLHPHTDLPLGTMANKEEREARKANKAAFNRMMVEAGIGRGEAYDLLSKHTGIPRSECHWSMFGVERAQMAGDACRKLLREKS